jgi:N-acetylglucosamine-6-phosphate deacetylase
MKVFRFTGGRVATASGVLDGAEIRVKQDRIASIAPLNDPSGAVDLAGGWVLPGFIDTQVNGGGGVLFNDAISIDGIAAIGAAHARFGTTGFLPTLISEDVDGIAAALDAVDAAIDAGVAGVLGVHIEGPVLNPARNGIHDATKFRRLDHNLISLLTKRRRGRVLLTIAPERVDLADVGTLAKAGVIVSAGHTEATFEQAEAAFDAGVTGVTHLFNAMPPIYQRAPGIVGATLDDPRPWSGLIVDRVHVATPVLRMALKLRPFDKLMLVTDAMPSVGSNHKSFTLHGRKIDVADGRCVYTDGTLAGSDLDMATAVSNCVADLDLTPDRVALIASTNPAAFLGLSNERGALAPGLRADWVVLDADLRPVQTQLAERAAELTTV